ncbi:MAG: hypothetical protein Q7R68_11590 [Nitrospirales bacterium]|nr:hypothetical protein [Nitrospirales bacterium]
MLITVRCASLAVLFVIGCSDVMAAEEGLKEIREHSGVMARDAEDMVMHGGMGDTKAILHHCLEVTRHAQVILKLLPPTDPHGKEAAGLLQEAIRQCQRVESIGVNVDPGAPLNPAAKARTAVRAAVKHLSVLSGEGKH